MTEVGELLIGKLRGGGVGDIAHHHMVAGLETVQEQGGDGRHAAAEGHAILSRFQDRQLALQLGDGWVAPAGVDERRLVVHLVGREGDARIDDEGGRHDDIRSRGARELVRRGSGVDGGRLDAHLLGGVRRD